MPGNFEIQNIVFFLTQHIPWALNQSQEEEVQEGVADHVADVDDHLVVDEVGGGEANGDQHCSRAKDWRSKQTADLKNIYHNNNNNNKMVIMRTGLNFQIHLR